MRRMDTYKSPGTRKNAEFAISNFAFSESCAIALPFHGENPMVREKILRIGQFHRVRTRCIQSMGPHGASIDSQSPISVFGKIGDSSPFPWGKPYGLRGVFGFPDRSIGCISDVFNRWALTGPQSIRNRRFSVLRKSAIALPYHGELPMVRGPFWRIPIHRIDLQVIYSMDRV